MYNGSKNSKCNDPFDSPLNGHTLFALYSAFQKTKASVFGTNVVIPVGDTTDSCKVECDQASFGGISAVIRICVTASHRWKN